MYVDGPLTLTRSLSPLRFAGVERLHLVNCYISSGLTTSGGLTSAPRLALTRLTHLELSTPFPWSHWGGLLHPRVVPALVSLCVSSPAKLDDQPFGSPDAFEMGLAAIAPDLVEFATLGRSGLSRLLTHGQVWRHFARLKHLTLASARPHMTLEQIPSKLETLRIDYQPRGMDGFVFELSQIFELDADSLSELRQLSMPGWAALSGRRAQAVRDFVRDNCEERKIEWDEAEEGAVWEVSLRTGELCEWRIADRRPARWRLQSKIDRLTGR